MAKCASCDRDAPFEGARCRKCRAGKGPSTVKLRDAGKVGTPGARTLEAKSRYRNAPKRGWS